MTSDRDDAIARVAGVLYFHGTRGGKAAARSWGTTIVDRASTRADIASFLRHAGAPIRAIPAMTDRVAGILGIA